MNWVATVHRNRHAWASWLFVGALFAVSLTLGVVQYRWIGAVSRAETERLRATVQTSLNRFSQDFNAEIVGAASALMPDRSASGLPDRKPEYARRYRQWRAAVRHKELFRSVHLVVPAKKSAILYRFDDATGEFLASEWPQAWLDLRNRFAAAAGDGTPGPYTDDSISVFEVPYFARQAPGAPGREAEWLLLELDLDYLSRVVFPQRLARYLGTSGAVEYEAEVTPVADPKKRIYDSNPNGGAMSADAAVRFFHPRVDVILRRAGLWRGHTAGSDANIEPSGRWRLAVRHREGSVEAVVEKGRRRNLAATGALLLLLVLGAGAFLQYSRRAQKLADLQMQFVAGVSHELRTPLTVMRTAGHNLRGRVSLDPACVQQYGALIEQESGKLTGVVEKVLRFANANQGRVISERTPLDIGVVIDEALEADRTILTETKIPVEKQIEEALPAVLGDRATLRHAIGNLINNAARYGIGGDRIRISAARGDGFVQVVVEDHGPGIPAGEIRHVFDPFFRGRRAVENQIQGTGLGLSLAKRIVEAHEGSISVVSEPGKGTQFTVSLPATIEKDHEFTNSAD